MHKLSISLFLILLISCSDNEFINTHPPLQDGEGFCSFSIKIPTEKEKTKATNQGNANEQKLSKLRLVFYQNDVVKKVLDFTLNTTTNGIIGNADSIQTVAGRIDTFIVKPMAMKKGEYKIVALINPNSSVTELTETGKALSELENATIQTVTDLIGINGDYFYMANTSGPILCDESRFYENYEDALNNVNNKRLLLTVERAVAKVSLKLDAGLPNDIQIGSIILDKSRIQWAVDVTNTKLFWLRKMTFKRGGENSSLPSKNMEQQEDYTAYDNGQSRRLHLYAKDPNFETIAAPGSEFNYIDVSDIDRIDWKQPDAIVYILENTMHNDYFKMNLSTQVIIRIGVKGQANNYVYYRVPIRHFMDDGIIQNIGNEDKENPGGEEEGENGEGGYVGSAARRWGGYGVVRNNEYILNLRKVEILGSSTLTAPQDEWNIY